MGGGLGDGNNDGSKAGKQFVSMGVIVRPFGDMREKEAAIEELRRRGRYGEPIIEKLEKEEG